MGQLGAEFGHLVHLVHAFAGQEVEAVEVFFIVGEEHGVAGLLHGDDGFEDAAFALLDPLSHRVEVGGKVHSGGEDAHTVLALTLAVELLPPFVHEVEFRLEVHEDFNLLSGTIEGVAHGGILRGHIVFVGALCFHVGCPLDEGVDVETGAGDREQTHGGEHREAAAHVVGDDERGVALLRCGDAGSTFLGIGHGHDDFLCHFLATLLLTLLLEQAESERSFSGRAALGDVDDAEFAAAEVVAEFVEIVFADVVTGKEDDRIFAIVGEPLKLVAESFNHRARTEVGTADAGHHDGVAVLAQGLGAGFDFAQELRGDTAGQVHPSEEIVAGAGLIFECLLCGRHVGFHFIEHTGREKPGGIVEF